MKLKSKTTKRANGKYDLKITITTQQILATLARIDSERTDKIDLLDDY